MKKTREQVQSEALESLIAHNGVGTIVLSTGTGKTKVAIDYIRTLPADSNILITSPRTNLKDNWKSELGKWGVIQNTYAPSEYHIVTNTINLVCQFPTINIMFENIQTCYKWKDTQWDLIIIDEIHTCTTPEYFNLVKNNTYTHLIGLSATPDNHKLEKQALYNEYCPIIYTYKDSAKDKIINQRHYILWKYNLNNDFKVNVKTKDKNFDVGEASRYLYLNNEVDKWTAEMYNLGARNPFQQAVMWGIKAMGNTVQKSVSFKYMYAVRMRKEFLNNLFSSRYIATIIADAIQKGLPIPFSHQYTEPLSRSSKILFFSELTEQATKICEHTVHSKNTDEENKQRIIQFNTGEIKRLSSCNSLTLGLNLVGADIAIFESFNGSKTMFQQKAGRTDRLPIEDNAIVIFIIPKNTQSEKWFEQSTAGIITEENSTTVSTKEEFIKAFKGYKNINS